MDRQVIENNSFNTLTQVIYGCKSTWVSLFLSWRTVIIYYYTFLVPAVTVNSASVLFLSLLLPIKCWAFCEHFVAGAYL